MERTPVVLMVVLATFVAGEIIWSRLSERNVYNLRESLGNLGILAVNHVLKPVALSWNFLRAKVNCGV